MEDKSEGLQPNREQKQDQNVEPSDHQENVSDAIQKAQESTDDRVVEAAAKKDGLRGALAARMDVMNKHLDRVAKTRVTPQKGVLGFLNPSARAVDTMLARPIARLGSVTTGMLRDRLQPSARATTSKGK